jgi:hypothetical protein
MTPTDPSPIVPAGPSIATLARTTLVVLGAAVAILLAFVLPAEYAVDPLGTGRWLGLTEIAAPSGDHAAESAPQGAVMAPTRTGPIGTYPGEFTVDVFEVTLAPYEYVEYKYRLEKDATMIYSWAASAGLVHDLHGERLPGASDGPPEESFDKEERRQGNGSYTAPFTGIHGWFWENPGADPITVRLTTAGFYTAATEIRSDRSRHRRTLRTIDSLGVASGEAGRQGAP